MAVEQRYTLLKNRINNIYKKIDYDEDLCVKYIKRYDLIDPLESIVAVLVTIVSNVAAAYTQQYWLTLFTALSAILPIYTKYLQSRFKTMKRWSIFFRELRKFELDLDRYKEQIDETSMNEFLDDLDKTEDKISMAIVKELKVRTDKEERTEKEEE